MIGRCASQLSGIAHHGTVKRRCQYLRHLGRRNDVVWKHAPWPAAQCAPACHPMTLMTLRLPPAAVWPATLATPAKRAYFLTPSCGGRKPQRTGRDRYGVPRFWCPRNSLLPSRCGCTTMRNEGHASHTQVGDHCVLPAHCSLFGCGGFW